MTLASRTIGGRGHEGAVIVALANGSTDALDDV
jgi:hypothetical protein